MPEVRLAVVLALVAACGRIGFDDQVDAPNGVPDAPPDAVPYREPGGRGDPDFGMGGQVITGVGGVEHGEDSAPRAGGGYLVAGFRSNGAVTTFEVVGLTAIGTVDPTFGTNGYAFPTINNDDFGYGLAARPDGTTLIVGDGGPTTEDDIVAGVIDARGATVTSYATNGFITINSGATASDTGRRAVQDGDTTYLCGTIRYDQASSEIAIIALDLGGQGIPSFNTDGVVFDPLTATNNYCADILVDRSGRIAITGSTGSGGMIARYLADGDLDPSFNGGGLASVTTGQMAALALAPNDDLVAAGENGSNGVIVRRTDRGGPATFGTAGVVTITGTPLYGMVIQPNGKIVVAGERDSGGNSNIVILRRNADGTPDLTFGVAGELVIDVSIEDRVRSLRQDADGKLIVVGYVTQGAAEKTLTVRID